MNQKPSLIQTLNSVPQVLTLDMKFDGAVRSLELSSLDQFSLLTGKEQGKYAFFTRFEEFDL